MHTAKTELAPERRAIERIKRKATAMAIATLTETSFADEVETEPDLEPDPELHLRGRSCRCPAANVKAYRDEDEWVCHPCGHQLSPRVASVLTLTTRTRAGGKPPPPQTHPRKRSTPTPRTPNDPARERPINERGLMCDASGELVAPPGGPHRRPASPIFRVMKR